MSRRHKDAGTNLREEIKLLCAELCTSTASKITKRRETGKRLLELLSKERNRSRLIEQMVDLAIANGHSRAKARKRSHMLVWGPIIKSAFLSAKVLVNAGSGKKSKLNPDDVKLPLKILQYSDMSSADDGNRVSIESTSKLDSKEVHDILNFCFDMLEKDDVRDMAEMDLMNTLVYVCERLDYVAHLKVEVDVLKILATVEVVLLEDETDAATAAARIFTAILESCVELGMGLFVVVNRCLKLAAKWCANQLEESSKNPRELSYLFRGITAIMRFHPDQSIKPLARYGRSLLQFSKRCYMAAIPQNKHAIHGYLIAHIIVNQKAGHLKGRLPGELGEIGKGMLNTEQLQQLLPMVLSSLAKVELTLTVKKRVGWKTLDATIRRHLECCARLLACSQRQFLMDQEWKLLEDPDDFFTSLAREFSKDKEDLVRSTTCSKYPCCPPSVLAGSPWARHVLKPLLVMLPEMKQNTEFSFGTVTTVDSFSQNSSQETGLLDSNPLIRHPLLNAIHESKNTKWETDITKSSMLLLVISACAEAFPTGRCWGSSSHKHWITLRLDEKEQKGEPVHINACAPGDLALLVHVVANVLEAAGRSTTGDPELQVLALLCLLRLTEAHSACVSLVREQDMTDLAASWRQVWAILFRSDLRYAASTAFASEGSCGELVLTLLTEIIQGWCTDPVVTFSQSVSQKQSTFLYRKQPQIWALPAFGKGISRRPKQVFELACAFLHRTCLSDEGRDNIHDGAPIGMEGESSDEGQRSVGRRYRLVCLCLHALDSLKPGASVGSNDQQLAMVVTACLSALVNGEISLWSRTYWDETQNLTWMRSSPPFDLKSKFCFTEMTGASPLLNKKSTHDAKSCLFHTLWTSPIPDPGASSLQQIRWLESQRSDYAVAEKLKVCAQIRSPEASSSHVDYVPTALSLSLHDFLTSQMKNLLVRWTLPEPEDSPAQTDDANSNLNAKEAALSVSSLWLKISLSTQVLIDDKKIYSGLEQVQESALPILERVSSGLPGLCEGREEFHSVFLDLLQVLRFLIEVSSVLSVELQPAWKDGISPLIGVCDSLLLSFAGQNQSSTAWDDDAGDDDQSTSSSESEGFQPKTNVSDLLDDSDDDEIVNKRKPVAKRQKTKKSKNSRKRKHAPGKRHDESPRKKKKQHPSPPDSSCARLVASVLVALEPSVSRCEFVLECLLKSGRQDSEVDLGDAFHCLGLLNDASVFFNEHALSQLDESKSANPMDESFRQQSPISLICSVVQKLRDSAPNSSSLYMFGFQLFAECVRLGDSDFRGLKMTMDEAKQIADYLLDGDPCLESRTYLRSIRLRAATEAYLLGDDNFHTAMEEFRKLVVESVKDLDPLVRFYSCHAAGAALHILSNKEAIVRAVSNRLPPVKIPVIGEETAKRKTYPEWYQTFDLGTGDLDAENAVWEDALMSMECSAIACRTVMAGAAATGDIVYDFIKISSARPTMQAQCFDACDRIALMLGYERAEDLLEDMSESLFGRWLQSGETLGGLPLLMTSPSLLRVLSQTGQLQNLIRTSPNEEGTKPLNANNLEDVATDEFVARHKAFIMPLILLRICSSEPTEELDAMSRISRDKNFEEFCITLKNNNDSATIKAIIQGGLHDIEAMCAPMNHSELATLGQKIAKLVGEVLTQDSETETQLKKGTKPHLAIRRILELSGKESRDIFPAPIVKEAFTEAISGLVDKLKPTKNGDILCAAGTSLTECLLYARKWLESATLTTQKELKWKTLALLFDLIFTQIRRNGFEHSQLSFGVNVLVDVLLNPSLTCIHSETLAILNQVLEEVVASAKESDLLKTQFAIASKRLVGSLMKIHEENQQKLIRASRAKSKERLQVLQRSVGLLGTRSPSDTWGWDANEVAGTVRSVNLETALRDFQFSRDAGSLVEAHLNQTFDLLLKVFDSAPILDLKQECFVGTLPPFSVSRSDQEALAATSKRFCAQTVALDFGKRNELNRSEDLAKSIDSLLEELKNRSSWMDSLSVTGKANSRDDCSSSLSMSQWMIRAALVQLEQKLRAARLLAETKHRDEDSFRLVKELAFVCGAACPDELRLAASRCMGELDPTLLDKPNAQLSEQTDHIQKALENDDLLRGIQAHAVEVLGEYLHAGHSGVAITAVDTLIALMATRDGTDCWTSLDLKIQHRLLPVLSGKKRVQNVSKISLSKTRLASLKSKAGSDAEMKDAEWCWSGNLWHCPNDLEASYESWICDLVPAIIVCCYCGDATNSQTSSTFFGACQKMSSIAPRFATAIFPGIILDLLERHANDVAESPQTVSGFKLVAQDTWIGAPGGSINKRLSSNFQILLGQSRESASTQNSQSIALALDTLDLLRRATQDRFLKSESHKRNSNAMPNNSSRSSKKANKNSKSAKSPKSSNDSVDTRNSQYNVDLGDVVAWRGLPFGTVLKLNGQLVVEACIRIQRYASALFYSALYFESCFSASGAVMEMLAKDFAAASARSVTFSKSDISGYFVDATACEPSLLRKRAVVSLRQLGECYLQLGEVDAYEATERQSSDLRYSDSNLLATCSGEEQRVLVPSLAELQRLDALSNTTQHPVFTSIQTADAIENLGLRNLLQSYIGSMDLQKMPSMPVTERRQLREKWFESRLYGMNWDIALSDAPQADSLGNLTALNKQVLGETELSREDMGFHEAIASALRAFAHDDLSCQGLLKIARASLLSPISAMATKESSGKGVCALVEKLQILNDVELLVQEPESADALLERWGFSEKVDLVQAPTKAVSTTSYASAGFAPHAREAVLRFLRFKKTSHHSPTKVFDPQQCLIEHLWTFGRWCRQMKHLPTAESSLQRLHSVLQATNGSIVAKSSSLDLILGQRLEEAHLREAKGDFATAIRVSKQVIGLLQEEKGRREGSDLSIDCVLVDSFLSCGGWLSKNKVEPAQVIMSSYHGPGAELAKKLFRQNRTKENAERFLKAQVALADLASGLYDSISARVKTPQWAKVGKSINDRQQELRSCEEMLVEVRDRQRKGSRKQQAQCFSEATELMHYGRQLKSEVRLALDERDRTKTALKEYLGLAVNSYASALAIAGVGQEQDMSRHVFRMVFLWLSNCSEVGKGDEHLYVNKLVDKYVDKIPSFRFVALTSQLFAQLDSVENCAFQATLHKLVEKMCMDHPYHTLVQLISVCNGKEVGEGVSGRNVEFFLENMSDSKIQAAERIAENLKRREPAYVGELLDGYKSLMAAYIRLANAPTTKFVEAGKTKGIPLSQASSKCHSLDRVLSRRQDCLPCMVTSPPPLRSGCDYGGGKEDPIGGERVKGFESTFSITDSGLHRPKIVICEGTRGGRYRQLVKGEDEIRQDAVMEQVFGYVNDLMRRKNADRARPGNAASSAGDLRMVTYNIIPLSPASGVLEWVEHSTTIGDYILDAKTTRGYRLGSHSRYYPGEWGNSRCRQHYGMSPKEEKKKSFEIVCKNSSPSFRFFFMERFGHDLKAWYTAKMRYTRSVAVSSIVGHILGIGDRHTNNILVSQITGEVVHIDFGIVFEQGKLLAVPELVPFRLTRNIVDGFGPTGTEGTFARSCESTAVVLRENANALLTILSAIASDPLYRWSVSPVEARRRQRLTDDDNQPGGTPNKQQSSSSKKDKRKSASGHTETKSERNEAAALVLNKIQEKLQGYEDGASGEQQGIEGQVQLLINSARDPANLSVMFAGWAPWI